MGNSSPFDGPDMARATMVHPAKLLYSPPSPIFVPTDPLPLPEDSLARCQSTMTPPQHPVGIVTPPVTPVHASKPVAVTKGEEMAGDDGVARLYDPADAPAPAFPAPLLETPKDELYYEIARKEPLGCGRFSTVYLARPLRPCRIRSAARDARALTPPSTPTKDSSTFADQSLPQLFAVKFPADKASVSVLRHEAAILSYLHAWARHSSHIVPFHGLNPHNSALVLSALPSSLGDLITNELAALPETTRVSTVASLFIQVANSLVDSLDWLHGTGIIHADIKPPNILLRPERALREPHDILFAPFTPLLSDFTSAFHHSATSPNSTPALGGGTYDFLAPELLQRPYPAPTPASDIYALAVTLLVFVTGESPFASAQNRFVLLDWAKQGTPIAFALADPRAASRLRGVAALTHSRLDLVRFLEGGLAKVPEERRLEI